MKISANDVSDTFGLGSLSLLLLFWLVVTSTNSVELADTVSTNFELPSFASTTISVAIIFALHAYGKALILIGDFFSKPKLLSVLKILVELDSVARESDQRLGEKFRKWITFIEGVVGLFAVGLLFQSLLVALLILNGEGNWDVYAFIWI